jgi:1-deoxy-D-xylulose-5-phosphate synthase
VGIAQEFLAPASRGQVLEQLGLTAQDVARAITAMVSRMQPHLSSSDENDLETEFAESDDVEPRHNVARGDSPL